MIKNVLFLCSLSSFSPFFPGSGCLCEAAPTRWYCQASPRCRFSAASLAQSQPQPSALGHALPTAFPRGFAMGRDSRADVGGAIFSQHWCLHQQWKRLGDKAHVIYSLLSLKISSDLQAVLNTMGALMDKDM